MVLPESVVGWFCPLHERLDGDTTPRRECLEGSRCQSFLRSFSVASRTAGRGMCRLVRGEERLECASVAAARVLEEDPDRVGHDRLLVGVQRGGDREALLDIAIAPRHHEEQRRGDRRPPPQRLGRGGERVEGVVRAAAQVPAHDPRRRAVDHVPRGDPVVPTQVDVVQLGQPVSPRPAEPAAGLEVEDAEGRHPGLVRRLVDQALDLRQRQAGRGLGGVEEVPHPHPDRRLVRRQALADRGQLRLVAQGLQPRDHLGGRRRLVAHVRARLVRPPSLVE